MSEPKIDAVDAIRSNALAGVPHAFFGRRGGVSEGVLASLDLGAGSRVVPGWIEENRARVVGAVAPGAELCTLYQVHSADVALVQARYADADRPHADALVSDRPGLLLGILTADCAPVLLADREAGVVGAAHAGWKGALAGVTDAAIAAMEHRGAKASRIVAAVGPCIARASYEVDDAFLRRFCQADAENERFFADGRTPGRYQFDLEAYVVHRLAAAGLARIDALGLDTYTDDTRFFSYRRATHRGEEDYGRQISVIAVG